jgi:hypothetical protein
MLDAKVLQSTSELLETVVTSLSKSFPPFPQKLYHYAPLETLQKIFEFDDLRLSHAEYSNDQRELVQANAVIDVRLSGYAGTPVFRHQVEQAFAAQAADLDAYIFCMSTGSQDKLSHWRAYAQDGRGGAITLDPWGLVELVHAIPGLRLELAPDF